MRTTLFLLLGYLSGSVLYARVFARVFGKEDMLDKSPDGNPGAANAFHYGGFLCGTLTLFCDLIKGFLPVFLFQHGAFPVGGDFSFSVSLVMAAPVVGHAFPLFFRFRGGKGIAATFGCLLGLIPLWQPFVLLALFFILFSVVLVVTPNYYKTFAAFLCALCSVLFFSPSGAATVGFFIITSVVLLRMLLSKEEKEKLEVKFFWMH